MPTLAAQARPSALAIDLALCRVATAAVKAIEGAQLGSLEIGAAAQLQRVFSERLASLSDNAGGLATHAAPEASIQRRLQETLASLAPVRRRQASENPVLLRELVDLLAAVAKPQGLQREQAESLLSALDRLNPPSRPAPPAPDLSQVPSALK